MVVKVFGGEEFSDYEHEWNQFKEVYRLINKKYKNTKELIYILSNFLVSNGQIDVLILTEKGPAILDLKSYRGKVIGNENGDWKVIDINGEEVPLKNLFGQLKSQRFAFLEKLNQIRIGNFEHIEADNLANIQCWGYFEIGSSYDIEQIGRGARKWFDVVTGDNLIEKMRFLDARYILRPQDMDAIVKGLNLKKYSFEEYTSQEECTFESNWKKELNVFVKPQNWDNILSKIKEKNIITVVGYPNVGKTTTIMNISEELRKLGYGIHEDRESLIKVFASIDDKDRREYHHLINNKNVFILDDLFGKSEYEPDLGNKWVYLIINILDSAIVQSKFIIGSRKDVIEKFLFSNNELRRWNLINEFKNSIVELNFTDYDQQNRKTIFDKNLNFIHLNNENTEAILNKNIGKITKELLLPGDIWYFIQKAKYREDFQESELNIYIDKAKQQLNSIAIEISSLIDYEKIFLYNLYINQDFNADDLEVIYFQCLSFSSTERNYFVDCIKKFENGFIKIKIEPELQSDRKIKKIEFIHPIYLEAIEKIINSDELERNKLEGILNRLYSLVELKNIGDWKSRDSNYNTVKFNIYKIALKYYTVFEIKDLAFKILDTLSFGLFFQVADYLEIEKPSWDPDNENSRFLTELFNNYDKFTEEEEKNYFNELFKKDELKEAIAYCFAYRLEPKIVVRFQDKLKELSSGNEEVKPLVAKCIIKNYKDFKEDNRELLFTLRIKGTLLIQLLMHNYNILPKELQDSLEKKIGSSDKAELIETCETFLLNYTFLPKEIRKDYDFVFDLKNELVVEYVGNAFVTWFMWTFKDNDLKRESIDEKVLDLYCNWLKNREIVLGNYGKLERLYGDVGTYGDIEYSILYYYESNLIKPKLIDPKYSKLKDALEINMAILLNSLPSTEYKAKIYVTAFDYYPGGGNKELIDKVRNIFHENDEIKLIFLDEILSIDQKIATKYPFKITPSQIAIIEKLSIAPNSTRVRSAAKEVLEYIKTSIDNHTMERVQDDFS